MPKYLTTFHNIHCPLYFRTSPEAYGISLMPALRARSSHLASSVLTSMAKASGVHQSASARCLICLTVQLRETERHLGSRQYRRRTGIGNVHTTVQSEQHTRSL
jgi:hypothetical protein